MGQSGRSGFRKRRFSGQAGVLNGRRVFARIRKLIRITRQRKYWRALAFGVAASTEHEGLLSELDCRTVVDVGANRGQFSTAVRASNPGARIIAVEPLARAAQTFRQVFRVHPDVLLFQVAAGATAGRTQIHVSGSDDSSSLLPITDLQELLYPGTAEVGIETVDVDRLDNVLRAVRIEPPALLKLDVQGYELEALRGSTGVIQEFAFVYVECSLAELYRGQARAGEVIEFLRGYGFALCGIYNPVQDVTGRVIQADFLFSGAAERGARAWG